MFRIALAVGIVVISFTSSVFAQTTPSSETSTTTVVPESMLTTIKEVYQAGYTTLELFRTTQSTHFATLRDQKRAAAGMPDTTPEQVSTEQKTPEVVVQSTFSYPMVVLTTAAASFFSNKTLFYIACGLVALLILRLFFKAFI